MPSPEVHHLYHGPVQDHSFSSDRSQLAVARENNVEIYSTSGSRFTLQDELCGHDRLVTGVDIAPNSGKIVTTSQDRNAYVWNFSEGTWKPVLVLLRINRAATCVRWSPDETKFAVGSGARVAAVCYYEEENDWYVSKHLRKPFHSTTTTVSWHPNSVLLGVGSTDGHARVLSAFIKGVDERPEPTAWGSRLPFNTVCGEFMNQTAGWVKGVAFSPSGDALAFVGMDSTITIAYPAGEDQPPKAVVSVSSQSLPFADLLWISESEIVCAGYDCAPLRFSGSESGWNLVSSLDPSANADGAGNVEKEESALNLFRQMDLKGKVKEEQLKTTHQNTITKVRAYSGHQISTSGMDGRVVIWTL